MNYKSSTKTEKKLVANWQNLKRIFISPENEESRSVLVKYMTQILFGLHEFLNTHVGVTEEESLKDMADRFRNTVIHDEPERKLENVIANLIEDIAPHAVNVASPYFIGHMTSAIPFFMVHLKAIVTALNQNVVKLETSKVVSVIEKQVLAKMHRLFYRKDENFYNMHVQNTQTTLGAFIEDGTLANITALWIARDHLLAPKNRFQGVEKEGINSAYKAYGIDRAVILVSRLCHFSLRKTGGILGIGNENIIAVDVDKSNKLDLNHLKNIIEKIKQDKKVKTKIIAIVGIAGTTETGTVDPLFAIGKICKKEKIYFHVDAAWGGPTVMSRKYRHLLNGIELADSITVDGHKQLFMPMTCGMVYFKNPEIMDHIIYHAQYVNRPGSVDLGIKSIAGSREACSLILDSTLKIMGRQGYALLVEYGIETAKKFAEEINKRADFQLITPPELNILTYRICAYDIQKKLNNSDEQQTKRINGQLNEINRSIQIMQREAGKSFVSRTTLYFNNNKKENIVVFRCVIMNPMTNINILNEILDEQEDIYIKNFT